MARGYVNKHRFNRKSMFLSLLLIMGLSFSLSAQKKEVRKEITESYKPAKDFTLGIDNKYGSIEIINWDKNECEVVVEMIAESSSEEKAKKLLDKIEVEINEGSAAVNFVTVIDFKDMKGKTSVEVNYKVHAPAAINADIIQKYGSVFIEEISGEATIAVTYGNLKAQSLLNAQNKANELSLAYSEASIKKAGILKAKAAYSELKLGSVEAYEGNITYSEYTVMNLSGALMLDAKYSEVEIDHVEAGFEVVDITLSYGDLKVIMDEKASYSYDIETKYGSLDAPEGAVVSKEDHGINKHARGSVGSATSGEVKLSAKYTDMTLR